MARTRQGVLSDYYRSLEQVFRQHRVCLTACVDVRKWLYRLKESQSAFYIFIMLFIWESWSTLYPLTTETLQLFASSTFDGVYRVINILLCFPLKSFHFWGRGQWLFNITTSFLGEEMKNTLSKWSCRGSFRDRESNYRVKNLLRFLKSTMGYLITKDA